MKRATSFLLILLLLSACGKGTTQDHSGPDPLRARAAVAERNLVRIRDAVVAYHQANQKAPESINDLADFGCRAEDIEASEDYSELGYTFYSLVFAQGKMTQGWFLASPRADREALRVRMNGVTGAFDYTAPGQELGVAPEADPASAE